MDGKKILKSVPSICPVCNKIIQASYCYEENGLNTGVYIEKQCPEHGVVRELVAKKLEDFQRWMEHKSINIPPKTSDSGKSRRDAQGCPFDCGLCTKHLQTPCCVVIDITERCNQKCPYCFASAKNTGARVEQEPSLKELGKMMDRLIEIGEEREFNLQISGGEPTIREDLPKIVELAKSKGFRYVQLNTNGRRIAEEENYARQLREAGVSVVFLQFDGTNDTIYTKLRGEKLWEIKEKAIEECRKARLPVTIVPTIVRGVNLENVGEIIGFMVRNMDIVKGVHFQPVSYFGRVPSDTKERTTMFDLLRELEEQTEFLKYDDFCPINTGHPLCCFYSTYIKQGGTISCIVSKEEKEKGISCCDIDNGEKALCCEEMDIVSRDRDYVLNQWTMSLENKNTGGASEGLANGLEEESQPLDFDSFLSRYQSSTFTITGMAFMDATNIDGERLKRCRVVQMTRDHQLIPFCAYNTIYREK